MEETLQKILENQMTSNNMLMKIQETQIQMVKDIEFLKQEIKRLDDRIDKLEKKMEEKFKRIDKRFEQIDKRFEQVDKRFEQEDEKFIGINKIIEDFKIETENNFKKLKNYLDENLTDIAFIFERYDNRFRKIEKLN